MFEKLLQDSKSCSKVAWKSKSCSEVAFLCFEAANYQLKCRCSWRISSCIDASYILHIDFFLLWSGYHQRENTGSRLFTEVKPCWIGLISERVTIYIKDPVLYSTGGQAGVVDINHAFLLYYKCCMWIEFRSILTWLRGFSPGTPVSSLFKKLTSSLIHQPVVLCCFEVIYGLCSGAERLTGSTAPSVRPRWAAPFEICKVHLIIFIC